MNVKRLWVYWQYQIFGFFFSGSGLNFGSSSSGPGMSKLAQWSTCWSGGSGPNSPKLPGHIQTTLEWASNDQKAALLAIESLNSSGFMFCNFLVLRHCVKYSLLVEIASRFTCPNECFFLKCACAHGPSRPCPMIFVRPSLASCRFCARHSLHELRPSKFHALTLPWLWSHLWLVPATICNPNMDVPTWFSVWEHLLLLFLL